MKKSGRIFISILLVLSVLLSNSGTVVSSAKSRTGMYELKNDEGSAFYWVKIKSLSDSIAKFSISYCTPSRISESGNVVGKKNGNKITFSCIGGYTGNRVKGTIKLCNKKLKIKTYGNDYISTHGKIWTLNWKPRFWTPKKKGTSSITGFYDESEGRKALKITVNKATDELYLEGWIYEGVYSEWKFQEQIKEKWYSTSSDFKIGFLTEIGTQYYTFDEGFESEGNFSYPVVEIQFEDGKINKMIVSS